MRFINKAFAANVVEIPEGQPIENVIDGIIKFLLPSIAAIVVLMAIYGGVLYMISGGDPEKTTKAKKTIFWAIIGIMIVVLSYAIMVTLNNIVVDKI